MEVTKKYLKSKKKLKVNNWKKIFDIIGIVINNKSWIEKIQSENGNIPIIEKVKYSNKKKENIPIRKKNIPIKKKNIPIRIKNSRYLFL